jgi:hypothetical protein
VNAPEGNRLIPLLHHLYTITLPIQHTCTYAHIHIHSGSPTTSIAALLSALQQVGTKDAAKDVQLLLESVQASPAGCCGELCTSGGLVAGSSHGLLRTAAQEGQTTYAVARQAADPSRSLSSQQASHCGLAFLRPESSSKSTECLSSTDVYGSIVSGAAKVQAVPRLVACPAVQQADAFAPYKLLPLPR